MENTIKVFDYVMLDTNDTNAVITPTDILVPSTCEPAQVDAVPAAASIAPLQVPTLAAGPIGKAQHFDMPQFDDVVVEWHDQSPCYDLQISDEQFLGSSFNKQAFSASKR